MRNTGAKIKNPLTNFENKWVAVTPDHKKVLASANTAKMLDRILVEKGLENIVLLKVLPFDVSLSPPCLKL